MGLIRVSLWTTHSPDSPETAGELLGFFANREDFLKMDRFGASEPPKQKLEASTLKGAAKRLVDDGRSGSIFLGSSKVGLTASIRWAEGRMMEWGIYLDDALVASEPGVAALFGLLRDLGLMVPIAFAGAAPDEEWKAKNWVTESGPGFTSSERVGVDLGRCLPGVYWLSVFGKAAIRAIGLEKFKRAPAARIECTPSCCLLLVRELPLGGTLAERLKGDDAVRRSLGDEFFFDISDVERACKAIPGLRP